ncbi:Gfo/Idh/MocA family oxidoreductase [bacterium]|nr:MAG: Gfo/Idh/MocA family oxidoreductase [bacterium]
MKHLRALQSIEGFSPIAIPRRKERACEFAREGYAVARDVEEAARMGARLCIVATDTARHVVDGLAALECGLDLLIEKPLALDAREGSRLRERAETVHRRVFVGCVMRFCESLGVFRGLLDRLGRIHSVRIECQSYLPDWRPSRPYKESYSARVEEGGVLRDLVHEIDYAGWIFGWPSAVQAKIRNLGRLGIAADEAADLTWEIPSGCVVSMTLDYLSRPARRRMCAMGEFGTLEWDGIEGTVVLGLGGAELEVVRSVQTCDQIFVKQAGAFIKTQEGIHDPRLTTSAEGVRALSVCDAARRASLNQREETVEYP